MASNVSAKVFEDYSKTSHISVKEAFQQRIDFLKSQIEQEYSFLRNRLRQLDEKCYASYSVPLANEMECIKSLMKTSKEKYEREKNFLFKEIKSTSEFLNEYFHSQRMQLDRVLSERQTEMQSLMRNFYSKLPYTTGHHEIVNEAATADETIATTSIVINKSELSCTNSSFLTEEEEQIKKISEKIRSLKAKIDSKKIRNANKRNATTITTVTETTANSSSVAEYYSTDHYDQDLEGDDKVGDADEIENDESEIIHLNEQIKILKSKMHLKANELHQNECGNQLYLPICQEINHNSYMGTYRIEPIEICSQQPQQSAKKVLFIDRNKRRKLCLITNLVIVIAHITILKTIFCYFIQN